MDTAANMFSVINQKRISFLRNIAFYACLIVIMLSVITLLGWQLHNEWLKSIIPGQTPTNQIEAIGLILVSISLILFLKKNNPYTTSLSFLLSLLTILISTSIYFGFISNVSPLVPNTVANFVFLGLSMLFLLFKKKFFARIAQFFALLAGAISFFAVLGYIYQVLVFYTFSSFPPMALNTALAFSFLSISLLFAKSDHGLMRIFVLQTFSSHLAFRILIALLTIPPFVGFIILMGQQSGWYDTNMTIAVLVIANIVIFTILLWVNTYSLQQLELEQLIIREELKNKNVTLELNAKELSTKLLHLEEEKQETIDEIVQREIFSKGIHI